MAPSSQQKDAKIQNIVPAKEYGYCRVSRPTQNIDRQERNIQSAYPEAVILKEVHTRTSFEGRTVWNNLMKRIKPGDTIIFDSVSRMSGSTEEGTAAYQELYSKGVNLVFLNEPHINTDTYKSALRNQIAMTGSNVDLILEGINKFLMELAAEQIRLAFAQSEKEVEDLRKRTRGGIETARVQGKQIGRQRGRTYETQKSVEAKKKILKWSKHFHGQMTNAECIEALGISKDTFYKYLHEIQQAAIQNKEEE